MFSRSHAIIEEAKRFAETAVDDMLAGQTRRKNPVPASSFPSPASSTTVLSPQSVRCGLGKGIPGQTYH
jgi:hypothetical protein